MSAPDIEALLKPVSPDSECGPNMEYEPVFFELQELARGKPEQQIGDRIKPAQEPSWPKVRDAAEALLGSTKDLRVAGVLLRALIKVDGIAGLSASLALVEGLLSRYWDHIHPLLDAEDDNDPTFRLNALTTALAGDDAIAAIRLAPLVESRQFGRLSLRNRRIATGALKVESVDGQSVDETQELAKLESAFLETSVEALSATAASAVAANESLNSIQKILLDRADGIPAELAPLAADIKEIKSVLEEHLAKRGVAPGTSDSASATQDAARGTAGSGGAQPMSGQILSRADVIRAIDGICDYYSRSEPSSPVPMLLLRAKRLIDKDFMSIIRDLTPAGISEAEVLSGLESKNS